MDKDVIKATLTGLLNDIATRARKDAIAGESDIGSIFRREGPSLTSLDMKAIDQAIANIERATATKEGARRLMNGLMIAAKTAARIVL